MYFERTIKLYFYIACFLQQKAKLNGITPSIKPILKKIKDTDFRISIELEIIALQEAGE
jgi:predicted nucleic acid-binding protein